MADRVDAAMQDVEPPQAEPPVDRTGADAGVDELAPCDDAVLSLRQVRDPAIDGTNVTFTPAMRRQLLVRFGMPPGWRAGARVWRAGCYRLRSAWPCLKAAGA